jgi:hypothetical protein
MHGTFQQRRRARKINHPINRDISARQGAKIKYQPSLERGKASRHTRQEATWLKPAAFTHSIRMEAQLDEVVQVMAEALRNKVEQECGVVDDEHHEHDHCR